jgi:crotonobetaine/carnitine-CoA ligase
VEGKRIKACVQPKAGEGIRPEDLLDFCQGKIAHHMIPHYIEFMEQLPRLGGTEKVAKADMERAGISDKVWDREKAGYKIKRL